LKEEYLLKRVYSDDQNEWNTHTIYTMAEIVRNVIPGLIKRKEDAEQAMACIKRYTDADCPSRELVNDAEKYGSYHLHVLRTKVAVAGIRGWENTLQFSRKLEEAAFADPRLALQAGEVWAGDTVDGEGGDPIALAAEVFVRAALASDADELMPVDEESGVRGGDQRNRNRCGHGKLYFFGNGHHKHTCWPVDEPHKIKYRSWKVCHDGCGCCRQNLRADGGREN
jgi:hypothetical protein